LSQRQSYRYALSLPAGVEELSIAGDFVPGYPQCREAFDLKKLTNLKRLTLFPDEPFKPGFLKFMPPNLEALCVDATRWPSSEPHTPNSTLISSLH
jgi:hypothetical protein